MAMAMQATVSERVSEQVDDFALMRWQKSADFVAGPVAGIAAKVDLLLCVSFADTADGRMQCAV